MSDPLENFLTGIHRQVSKVPVENAFSEYGLGQNPFPPNRTITPDVIYGQDNNVHRFLSTCVEIFSANEPQRRAVAVVAGTGGGKSHFLRYCQNAFPKLSSKYEQRFVLSEFIAGSGKMIDLIRTILRDTDLFCRDLDSCDFLVALVRQLKSDQSHLEHIKQPDVRTCLKKLCAAAVAKDNSLEYMLVTARKWINAEALSQTEKKQLGIVSRLTTPAMAVQVLKELFVLARKVQLFEGLFLCIDEIESLFTRGMSPSQITAFLQDIRYFYDESVRDNEGFDLLLLTASTTTGASNLLRFNPPIFQRFGYERENRLLLTQIASAVEAVDFSYKYVDHFADKWRETKPKAKATKSARAIISAKEIESAFVTASAGGPAAAPGSLLDRLHNTVQDKFSDSTQQDISN
jgi:hypothetical protein